MSHICMRCANFMPADGREPYALPAVTSVAFRLACEHCRHSADFSCTYRIEGWPLLGEVLCPDFEEHE